MEQFENKVYSQNGEDGIIEYIFDVVGSDSGILVEIGVQDGKECNTRYMAEKDGFYNIMFDSDYYPNPLIIEQYFTAENINQVFDGMGMHKNIDLLSIDIDSNDLWVWNALSDEYKPRLVVIEYNAKVPPTEAKTVVYDPDLVWDGSDYVGASLKALWYVAKKKGYSLVYCENRGVNAFFVRDDLLNDQIIVKTPEEAYKSPQYGEQVDGIFTGHRDGDRQMVEVDENLKTVQ